MTTGKFFNRGVMALDSPYIRHVIRETEDKIVVFGERNEDTTSQNKMDRGASTIL
jgi:hypothetical protein